MLQQPSIDEILPPTTSTWKVLVADDNPINRKLLREFLRRDGYQVVEAADGDEAVRLFESSTVDFVFMDVMMPVLDGYEAVRRIKELCRQQGRFCPVLFVTAASDDRALADCIACGGDDFLTKPFNHTIMRAKMRALERSRDLYELVRRQKDELAEHHEHLRQQHEIAERTFGKLMRSGELDAPNLRHMLVPVSITSGDLLLAAYRPDGVQHILLGDFTGHGLAAAMGAIPVTDTFQSMTQKGFAIDQIAAEINRKLKANLPVGLFLAACLLSLDSRAGRLCIWNGGVPDVLVKSTADGVRARLSSRHLPLGILADELFDAELDCACVGIGDRIYAYSDGLIEAENPAGELFGEARLLGLLSEPGSAGDFDRIHTSLEAFRQEQAQRDDITLMEIECVPPVPLAPEAVNMRREEGALRLQVDFGVERLRMGNAQPELARMLDIFPGLGAHRSTLYTILAELFNNALEHGLLQLDSALKHDASGFDEYYRQREEKVGRMEHGSIHVELQLTGDSGRGAMHIEVEDTGPGFDHAARQVASAGQGLAHRGLLLVESLCRELVFHAPGNRVEALYTWAGE